MGALEEVIKMQQQGLSESQIIEYLQQQGLSYKEISEALAQNKIKEAIEESPLEPPQQESNSAEMASMQQSNYENVQMQAQPSPAGMQKSMMVQDSGETQQYFPTQESQPYDQNYGQYEYSSAISPDTITEISEQVVSEKMSEIRKKMEKMIDFKTALEAKTESIEERLKRIEKIIDTLQSSVLRKVGDYVNNVEDIKKELISTQQAFTAIAKHKNEKKSHSEHNQQHPQHHSPEHHKSHEHRK